MGDLDYFDDLIDFDYLNGFDDFADLDVFDYFDDFDYFNDFDDFTVVVPRKSKRADQINYAALLLYFADLAYSDATSMSTLADRMDCAAVTDLTCDSPMVMSLEATGQR